MQCFLIWAGNRRNTAPKQQQKPADQKTAGMQKKLCLTFSFSYLHNREEKPEQKTTHQIPADRTSQPLLFSLAAGKCDFERMCIFRVGKSFLHTSTKYPIPPHTAATINISQHPYVRSTHPRV